MTQNIDKIFHSDKIITYTKRNAITVKGVDKNTI
jgi:hypothetical protein